MPEKPAAQRFSCLTFFLAVPEYYDILDSSRAVKTDTEANPKILTRIVSIVMNNRVLSDRYISNLFAGLETEENYVFLDTSKPDKTNSQSLLFTKPHQHIRYRFGDDRASFYREIQGCLEKGLYCAGWFSYEFLHDDSLGRVIASAHLSGTIGAEFGVYSAPDRLRHVDEQGEPADFGTSSRPEETYQLRNLRPNIDRDEFYRAIGTILDYIAAGDTYQVNYTFKLHFDFRGSLAAFYRDLRRSQPVPYGCCIRNKERYILSFSPELFFRAEGEKIIARPMKGTIARGRTGEEDLANATILHNDVKNRSENVMIVDLLRNDLSRLTEATGGGSVQVTSLFDIEQYRSVLQMTSTVEATRTGKQRLTAEQIIEAIFPCGSVTGAPKIRTMEIIDELEKEPRGVYTGAIGYFSPAGAAIFNVPIRTVVLAGTSGEMGIGSGIVADSLPESEWQECLLKSKFLTDPLPNFELIETLLYHPRQGYLFIDEHVQRLASSADYFGFACDCAMVHSRLLSYAGLLTDSSCHRVRLCLSSTGEIQLDSSECGEPEHLELPRPSETSCDQPVLIDFSGSAMDTSSPWVFHKTTRREIYDRAHDKARAEGLFDVVFSNERDEITEGCISNIIILKDGCYYTPPLRSGLLDGIMRRAILERQVSLPVRERILFRDDLLQADKLYLCNSVRGVLPARLKKMA